jgi:hypothetical protein
MRQHQEQLHLDTIVVHPRNPSRDQIDRPMCSILSEERGISNKDSETKGGIDEALGCCIAMTSTTNDGMTRPTRTQIIVIRHLEGDQELDLLAKIDLMSFADYP